MLPQNIYNTSKYISTCFRSHKNVRLCDIIDIRDQNFIMHKRHITLIVRFNHHYIILSLNSNYGQFVIKEEI